MANDKEFNYGIKLTFSKGSDLSPQLAQVQKQLTTLATEKGVTSGGALEHLDKQLLGVLNRLKTLQAQIESHKDKGLEPGDAIIAEDVRRANIAITQFTNKVTQQLSIVANKAQAATTIVDDLNAGKFKGIHLTEGTDPERNAQRPVVDPRLGYAGVTSEDAARIAKGDPMLRRAREEAKPTEMLPSISDLVTKTRELSDETKALQAANSELLQTLREEVKAEKESVTNLRRAQGQVVPETGRPLGPSKSNPGDLTQPTGGLADTFEAERAKRAQVAADLAKLQDPGFTEEAAMATAAAEAVGKDRAALEALMETRKKDADEKESRRVLFDRPSVSNQPAPEQTAEPVNKFAEALAKRTAASSDATEAAAKDTSALEREAQAMENVTTESTKAADAVGKAADAATKNAGVAQPPPPRNAAGPGSSADEIAAMDAKAAAARDLADADAKVAEFAGKVAAAEKQGASAVKEGKDVTEKATKAVNDNTAAKKKRIEVTVIGAEGAEEEKLVKRIEQSTGALLKDVRARNDRLQVGIKINSAEKKAAADHAKEIEANQAQMEGFASTTNEILPESELKLQQLVATLVEATENGGDFEQSLAILQNRIGKLAVQGSTDLKALGEQFGLTEKQAIRLRDSIAAETSNDQFRLTFRQTRSFGSTFQSLTGIGSAAGRLGATGVQQGLDQAGGLAEVVENLPRLNASLKALPDTIRNLVSQIGTPTIGLAGSLVLLAALASVAADADNKRAEAAKKLLEAQGEYFKLVETGTTESITSKRQELTQQREAAQRNIDLQQAQLDAIQASSVQFLGLAQPINSPLIQLGVTLGLTGGEIRTLRDDLNTGKSSVAAMDKEIHDLDVASGDAQVKINDLVVAEKRRADQLVANANRDLGIREQILGLSGKSSEDLKKQREDLLQQNANLATARAALGQFPFVGGTDDPRTKQFDEFNRQIDANKQLIDAITNSYLNNATALEQADLRAKGFVSGLEEETARQEQLNKLLQSGDAEGVGNRLQEITDSLAALQVAQGKLLPVADALGGALGKAANEEFGRNLEEITRLEGERQDILEYGPVILKKAKDAITSELNDIAGKLKDDLTKMADDFHDAVIKAEDKAAEDEADAVDKRDKALQKAQEKYDEATLKSDAKHKKKLKDIDDKYGDDLEDAIRSRNAAAAITALRNAAKAKKDENDSYEESKKDLKDNLEDQRKEILDAYNEQIDNIVDSMKKQLKELREGYAKQVREAKDAAAAESREKVKAYNDQTRSLLNFLAGQTQITSRAQADQLTTLFNWSVGSSRLIDQFAVNAQSSLQRMITSLERAQAQTQSANLGTVSLTQNISGGSASAAQIAAIAAQKNSAILRKALGKSKTGGV